MKLIKVESFYISDYKYKKIGQVIHIPETSISYIKESNGSLAIHLIDKSVHFTDQTIEQLTSQTKKVKVKK